MPFTGGEQANTARVFTADTPHFNLVSAHDNSRQQQSYQHRHQPSLPVKPEGVDMPRLVMPPPMPVLTVGQLQMPFVMQSRTANVSTANSARKDDLYRVPAGYSQRQVDFMPSTSVNLKESQISYNN